MICLLGSESVEKALYYNMRVDCHLRQSGLSFLCFFVAEIRLARERTFVTAART